VEPDFRRIHDTYAAAIDVGAKWIQVLTWNDFAEDTDILPSKNKGRALLDVFAYYNTWFKTGVQPVPVENKVVISYPLRVPEHVVTKAPAYRRRNKDLFPVPERVAAPPYAPKVKYWAHIKTPVSLEVIGVGKAVFDKPGLWIGEVGAIAPGSVAVRLGGVSMELPPVMRTEREEFRTGAGGLEHRYVDLTMRR
jgi:hypothetical protein